MVIIGIDAHKRSHTVVAVDEQGRQLAQRTVGTTSGDHLELVAWAAKLEEARLWAVEDCRHLSRRLERDLLAAGERIVRVPPKLMANARNAARSFGKSDPIDALAVARAALRPGRICPRNLSPDRALRQLPLQGAPCLQVFSFLTLSRLPSTPSLPWSWSDRHWAGSAPSDIAAFAACFAA